MKKYSKKYLSKKTKKVQETSQNSFDKELEEKIKYCEYLISTFETKKENKNFQKWVLIICGVFMLILLLCLFNQTDLSQENKEVVTPIICSIGIPLVVCMITNCNSRIRNSKIENETRINEFIKTAQPLYIGGYLKNRNYKKILNYYLYFTNQKSKDLIADDDEPDLL